ncbi:uncharacterized protein [Henckelia pumila]|uniref:uncharacterized protein isoform X2 n=1 Tax=Henckelia pumila TaxID=405737 RepID=UPI003C6DF3E3
MQQTIMEDATLYRHLHKLVGLKSAEELENLLEMLWQTRKTGLSAPQKSSLQSLLRLPILTDLDPVLACLRSLLMKYLNESFGGNYILKLLPPDMTLEMQSILLVTLQKHQSQWKEELSQEERLFGKTRFSYQLNAGLPMPSPSFSFTEVSGSLLPRQYPITQFSSHNFGGHNSIAAERNVLSFPSMLTLQNDAFPGDTVLQDCNKSPPTDTEVKFQLTKDTLEAVLRSLTYINEQLSRFEGLSSSLQKKQRR